MPILYGAARSRSTRIAWLLEELELEWEWRPVDFAAGDHRSPAFLALNPAGKVPALQDGALVLSESLAIARYLCARHPEAGLLPPEGTAAGARVDQWLAFVLSELEQPLWTRAKHTFALPRDWRVPAVRETADKELARAATVATAMLGDRPYAAGDRFTVADVFLAHTCAWARAFRQGDSLGPALDAYADRVLARPALARAHARERSGTPTDPSK